MNGNGLMTLCATSVRNAPYLLGSGNMYGSGINTSELQNVSDENIFLLDMTKIASSSDVVDLKCIRIDYVGNPSKEEIENLFEYYMISLKNCKSNWLSIYTHHMLSADMQFFKDTCIDSFKHYPNDTNTGGSIVYNLFFDYLCPNGIMTKMLRNKKNIDKDKSDKENNMCPYFYIKYIDQQNINIVSVKLITYTYFFDTDILKEFNIYDHIHIRGENNESGIQLKYNKIYGGKYICARTFFNECSNKVSHSFHTINGLSHGFFIKFNDNIKLTKIKIKYFDKTMIELLDHIDIDIYTIKFNNWIYVPLSTMKRKIKDINDCFLFEGDGAVDLSRIDDMTVEIETDNNIQRIDYMFPLYMLMYPADAYGNVSPINIIKKKSTGLCACHPASSRFDRNDIFDFDILDKILDRI